MRVTFVDATESVRWQCLWVAQCLGPCARRRGARGDEEVASSLRTGASRWAPGVFV